MLRARRECVLMSDTVEFGYPGLTLNVGDHVCAFYNGPAERDQILQSYLGAGLVCGDMCVCVLDDAEAVAPLTAALTEGMEATSPPPQLQLKVSQDTYLLGGRFSTSAMLAFWDTVVGEAIADGHLFSRAVGEMTWALRQMPGVEELVGYEAELNYFLPRYPQVILCLYDLERFDGEILVDILKTHPLVMVAGMVLDNPYYLEPDEFLAARLSS
jgi:MEDS: MEthanogen/methylotroph, DcmR Sensory domain